MTKIDRYLLSLPERVVRSAAAIAAGVVREVGEIVLPRRLRRTVLYRNMVDSTLRFLIEKVGEVEGTYKEEGRLADNFLIERTVGDGIDLAGLVAFHASPVWIMAALADLSGAGRDLFNDITSSLKQQGLLDPDTEFENVEQVLDGLERTAGQLTKSLRRPPLNIEALRQQWASLKQAAASISPIHMPTPELVRSQWTELQDAARNQQQSVFHLSSVLALSAVRALPEHLLWLTKSAGAATLRTGQFFASGVLDHYRNTLKEIHKIGYLEYCQHEFRPYLHAAAEQFSFSHATLTDRLLRLPR